MSNIHGLFSNTNNNKKKKNSRDDHDDDDEEDEEDDHEDSSNHRYVGGISQQGGGSGLAVQPNRNERTTADDIFRLAERDSNAEDPMGPSSSSSQPPQRRATITMYRNGFIVDDGPYRRLDDPANADFLKSLAEGRAPRELMAASGGSGSGGDAVVGLVDKRHEDYEEPFRSFSGTGHALTASTTTADDAANNNGAGIYHRDELLASSSTSNTTSTTMTSIAVRLPNGKRHVLKISSGATIREMMIQLCQEVSDLPPSFRIISGYPPKPLMDDDTTTIADAKLQGAQISIQNV